MKEKNLLEVYNLKKSFPIKKGFLSQRNEFAWVVNDINFQIKTGETLGIVGETGCGKSILLRTILLIEKPTEGKIIFNGRNLLELSREEIKHIRRDIQLIFQDPLGSLHPRISIYENLALALTIHKIGNRKEQEERVIEVLRLVGLDPEFRHRYPHQLSGGQRQRVGVARAMVLNPKMILCDEPISSLDVSLQAQVINLFLDLQDKFKLTYLFIAHDLAVLRQISNRIAIMYLGRFVEVGSKEDIYNRAQHPYTRALLLSSPTIAKGLQGERITQEVVWGEVPDASRPPTGCAFHPRCKHAFEHCRIEPPPLKEFERGHWVACYLADKG